MENDKAKRRYRVELRMGEDFEPTLDEAHRATLSVLGAGEQGEVLHEGLLLAQTRMSAGFNCSTFNVDPFGGDERAMSRRNTYFCFEEGRWWVKDGSSTNGTYHNGERLRGDERRELRDGDLIDVGGRREDEADRGRPRGGVRVRFHAPRGGR